MLGAIYNLLPFSKKYALSHLVPKTTVGGCKCQHYSNYKRGTQISESYFPGTISQNLEGSEPGLQLSAVC